MKVTRRLGAGALVLGLAAPLAGSPYRTARGKLDIDAAAAAIERGEDHVSAIQLATWIRDRKPGLRVVDVRAPAEFAAYAIPTAENLPIASLTRAAFAPSDTVVLYSEGGAHAGQAWVLLRAMGVANAVFLAGGLADWRDEVIAPVLPAGASPEAVKAFEANAELSRYFGGVPQVGVAGAPSPAEPAGPAAGLAAIRRRGC